MVRNIPDRCRSTPGGENNDHASEQPNARPAARMETKSLGSHPLRLNIVTLITKSVVFRHRHHRYQRLIAPRINCPLPLKRRARSEWGAESTAFVSVIDAFASRIHPLMSNYVTYCSLLRSSGEVRMTWWAGDQSFAVD